MKCCSSAIALALAAVSTISAQTAPLQPPADFNSKLRDKCFIEGKVLRASDGSPLKKAVVSALPQSPQGSPIRPVTAITDAEGRFLLKDLDPGSYNLSAARTGYVRQVYGQRVPMGPGTAITLVEGQTLKDVVFRLLAGAVISGRVVDEDSEPVSGVRIQALRWGYRSGKRELLPGGYAQTDDRGEYRMFQIAPGRYYVSATYTGTGYVGGGVTISYAGDSAGEAYAATYYPGVSDPAQASALEVRPGDDLPGVNFRLLPSRAVRIRGRVIKAGGEPLRGGVMVQIYPRSAFGFIMFDRGGNTDERGSFELRGVTPGSYVLWADSESSGKRYQARTEVEVDTSDLEGIVLLLRPPLEVQGHVRVDGSVALEPSRVHLALVPREPPMFGARPAILDADLSFKLSDVSDGDYLLRVSGLPPDAYVSSAVMGKRDVLNDGVSLRGNAEPLRVIVSAPGGRIEGAVVDDSEQPSPGVRIVLVPEESHWKRQDLFRVTSSDQYGHFSIRGIPPGKYKLFAWELVEEGAYFDPEFLRPIFERGVSVDIASAAGADLRLKVIRSEGAGP